MRCGTASKNISDGARTCRSISKTRPWNEIDAGRNLGTNKAGTHNGHTIIATLNIVTGELLAPDEAGLSEAAWRLLGARTGDAVTLAHPPVLESLSLVRAKVYGRRLSDADMQAIVSDVAAGRYADIHLATFIAACAGDRLDLAEMVALTRAMIDISTARTMMETVSHLQRARLAPSVCIGVHAAFAGDAYEALRAAGAARVVTCNTIAHASNAIDLSDLLAAGVRAMIASISMAGEGS